MYFVKYSEIKNQIENEQFEKNVKNKYDANNDARYQYVFN